MSRVFLLAAMLFLALPTHARRSSEPVCQTLWSAYEILVDGLDAAVATAQARPRDPEPLARAQALHEDLRRALAEIVIAGCI
jgi:hypothetical protein